MGYLLSGTMSLIVVPISVLLGFLAGLKFGFWAGSALAIGSMLTIFVITAVSGLGSRLAVKERESRLWAETRKKLEQTKEVRKKLATMRVPDSDIQELLRLASMKGLSYIAACEKYKTREPKACNALAECIELSDIYMHELDGSAIEQRFKIADQDPFALAKQRTINALQERIKIVEDANTFLRGGPPSMHMEIKESL